jgi:hypothetical protein
MMDGRSGRNSSVRSDDIHLVDGPSAVPIGVYSAWVIGYDLPWICGLWRANEAPDPT